MILRGSQESGSVENFEYQAKFLEKREQLLVILQEGKALRYVKNYLVDKIQVLIQYCQ